VRTLDRLFMALGTPQTVVTPAGFARISAVKVRGLVALAA
jgi:hypothetical protein